MSNERLKKMLRELEFYEDLARKSVDECLKQLELERERINYKPLPWYKRIWFYFHGLNVK